MDPDGPAEKGKGKSSENVPGWSSHAAVEGDDDWLSQPGDEDETAWDRSGWSEREFTSGEADDGRADDFDFPDDDEGSDWDSDADEAPMDHSFDEEPTSWDDEDREGFEFSEDVEFKEEREEDGGLVFKEETEVEMKRTTDRSTKKKVARKPKKRKKRSHKRIAKAKAVKKKREAALKGDEMEFVADNRRNYRKKKKPSDIDAFFASDEEREEFKRSYKRADTSLQDEEKEYLEEMKEQWDVVHQQEDQHLVKGIGRLTDDDISHTTNPDAKSMTRMGRWAAALLIFMILAFLIFIMSYLGVLPKIPFLPYLIGTVVVRDLTNIGTQ